MRITRALLAAGLTVVSIAAVLPGAASAAPSWKGLTGPAGTGLQACVAHAKTQRPSSWTCMGGELTTAAANGTPTTTIVADDFQQTASVADRVGIAADDYDSWCESGSVCGRTVGGNYIAEVKGNAAYGNAAGVIGAFDFIVRQAFEGTRPRWRNTLIWDYGPQMQPQEFTNNCRTNVTGPDGYCGQNPFYFANVSSGSWRSDKPSTTGYYYNSQLTAGSGKYHDDNYGSFFASGYSQLFYAPTIHTGRWNQCTVSPGCRYYQVPWA
ncbi:hypothetical protein [Micromonospora rifamycinica]|uniref:Peptidase inhibitor family I36 n=1 Tax=Micromonospora rifamycinica TaxID=291594 RepID=A0A1C5H5F2_9ACTN|nr:hypothetical protein [Micromonospora rifamycinica]SCG41117.1 hypothetical protein GA0070623_0750 [Micromonospora rifamycinica]